MGALLYWRFHDRLSLEASFVVRAFGHTDATVAPNISTTSESVSGYSWEVPLLLISGSAIGATVSGGVELKAGQVRLRPELRYSWFERPLYDFCYVKPRQDSFTLIFAVSQITRRR
ncbi:MAG TPA: hypothetical protein VH157_01460 [Bryobacteraceae bacterium]|jgi:hypothetical protein|nr:hypothetical protein [Bryobacteraceae bacterium]